MCDEKGTLDSDDFDIKIIFTLKGGRSIHREIQLQIAMDDNTPCERLSLF